MRYGFRSLIRRSVFVLVLVTGGLMAPAMAADDVRLSGTEENGFGRLVFSWPDTGLPEDPTVPDTRLPGYETLVSACVLVVTFERPRDILLSSEWMPTTVHCAWR